MNTNLRRIAFLGIMTASSFAFAEEMPAGDATKGMKIFKKCMACHEAGPDAKIKSGPPLSGLIGRPIASFEGFKYGKSIKELGATGKTWDEQTVFDYLKNPKKYLRKVLDNKKAKSKMSFRLKKEQDRADIVAYLQSL